MLKVVAAELEKHRIDIAAIKMIRSAVLDTGNFISMYSGNDSNTTGTGFIINRKYKQAIMYFEAVDERICSLRMGGKFCNFTIISV